MLGAPALERIADGLDLACRPESAREALSHLRDRCTAIGDRWGAALLGLFGAVAGLPAGRLTADEHAAPRGRADRARGARARHLVLDDGRGRGRARRTHEPEQGRPTSSGRRPASARSRTPSRCWRRAPGRAGSGRRAWPAPAARPPGRASCCGACARRPRNVTTEASAPLEVRCIGGFTVLRDGVPVPLDALRPQHQALLRALALHAPLPVHRERLVEWFWEGRDPDRAQHSLQVADQRAARAARPRRPAHTGHVRGAADRRRRTRCSSTPTTGTTCGASSGYLAAGRSALERGDVDAARRDLAAGVPGAQRPTSCPTTAPRSGSPASATRCARRWSARAGRWRTCAPQPATDPPRSRSRGTLSRSTGTRTACGCA